MDSIAYLKDKFGKLNIFSNQSKKYRPGLCCIGFHSKGFTFAHIERHHNTVVLQAFESVACDAKKIPLILPQIVKDYQLEGVACSWMLQPENYQLFSIEALPVTAIEFQAAIRWKIKKLLSFPLEDAVIDSYPIPPAMIADPKKMITVVVSRASYLKPMVDLINASGLILTTIDIPEIALRNIVSFYDKDEMCSALVSLQEKTSHIYISRQNEFYLSRRLDWGLDLLPITAETVAPYLDRLALEIQRSFDYFQSQWRFPPPARVFLAPIKAVPIDIMAHLSQRLAATVSNLNLNEVLNPKHKLSLDQQNLYLPIIGGALRKEIVHVTAN